MIRVNEDELEYTDELIYTWQGKPFTGIGYEHLRTGERIEVSYLDGRQTGIAREWYPDGTLKSEEHYVNGSKHGICQEWFKNGQLKTEAFYEFSIRVKEKIWNEKGELVQEFEISENDNRYSTLTTFRQTRGKTEPPVENK